MPPIRIMPLTDATLARATKTLAAGDPAIAAIVDRHGVPPMWPIDTGFGGLVDIILGQQVSVASAKAAWNRLVERIGAPTPSRLLTLDDAAMHAIGFSRQKTGYARDLARTLEDGRLDLDAIADRSDDEARSTLMQIRGIGRWSADIYMLMALKRPDVWPAGDLALVIATREAHELDGDTDEAGIERLADQWRPWRSVAARILWMDYLRRRGRDL